MGVLKKLEPAKLTFNLNLSKGECHLIKSGRCSLEKPTVKRKARKESDIGYCQQLYADLVTNGQREPIIVGKASGCGHYDFCDGQHRVCIAQRRELELLAEVEKEAGLCTKCSPPRTSPDKPETDVKVIVIDDSDTFKIGKIPRPRSGLKFNLKTSSQTSNYLKNKRQKKTVN